MCAEVAEHAARLDVAGYAKAKPSTRLRGIYLHRGGRRRAPDARGALQSADLPAAVGARGVYRPAGARPHQRAARPSGYDFPVFGSLWLEVLDTNDGKELSNFCKKFEAPLRNALTKAGKLVDDAAQAAPAADL